MNMRESWLSARRSGIGGSDAAAIIGVSPWRTPLDVYLDKTGQGVEQADSDPMLWGRLLEPVVRQRYADVTGREVLVPDVPNGIVVHPSIPYMLTTLDGYVDGAVRRVVEVKTARSGADWGEPGSDEIPDYYLPQVQHYLAVTGFSVADIAVLIAGSDFRIYTVEANPEFQELLIAAESVFWDHVQNGIPPAPVCAADVLRMYPRDDGRSVVASDDVLADMELAAALRQSIKSAELELEGDKKEGVLGVMDRIKTAIGQASSLLHPTTGKPIATWKAAKDGTETDWEAVARSLGAPAELIAAHTAVKTGSRRFLFK